MVCVGGGGWEEEWVSGCFHVDTYRVLAGHVNGLAVGIWQTGAVHRVAAMAVLLAVVQNAAATRATATARPAATAAARAAARTAAHQHLGGTVQRTPLRPGRLARLF